MSKKKKEKGNQSNVEIFASCQFFFSFSLFFFKEKLHFFCYRRAIWTWLYRQTSFTKRLLEIRWCRKAVQRDWSAKLEDILDHTLHGVERIMKI